MTHPKIALPKVVHSHQSKSPCNSGVLILAILILTIVTGTTGATAQTYAVVYNFDGVHGQYSSFSFLAQGRDGNLYGTAGGGTNQVGVVFQITPSGTPTALYNFEFESVNGFNPSGGLTLGTDGMFYGTTTAGGSNGMGTIFKITPTGTLTSLYSFTGGADGSQPYAPPIEGTDGSFYGTTSAGTAYKITRSGTLIPLSSLPGATLAPLIQGADGYFYGTSRYGGGSANCTDGCGTVFRMTSTGIVTVIHKFEGPDGSDPIGPVIQGSDGNLYGTTVADVFKLTPQGVYTVLHQFGRSYQNDGYTPVAGILQATDGNFYSVASEGGSVNCGTFFQFTAAGGYSILHNFDGLHGDGTVPETAPLQHTNGKIYGLTVSGGDDHRGNNNKGVLYRVDMGSGPFISLLSNTGTVGNKVEILGEGLTGTSRVTFNGTPTTFKIWSDTYLTATVPSGAATGPVALTTPTGTLTSNRRFRVRPVILNVSPASGGAGTQVVISGTSFTQTTKVTFGGGKEAAAFTVDSDTQVTATVPVGAPTGYIVLTTAGGRSRSPDTFTVMP